MADKPVTREEKYLAYLTGDYTGELPKPITRKEKYLYELCLKGMGGEVSPEEIKNAVNEYLEKNPVKPGATAEQAQQIEQNKTDVASLKENVKYLSNSYVTPEMFGAVGDGVTDDAEAIQYALDNSKYVHLNEKTYLVSKNIKINNYNVLEGSGFGSALKCADGFTGNLLLIDSVYNTEVKNLTLDGGCEFDFNKNSFTRLNGESVNGIYCDHTEHNIAVCRIKNIQINFFSGIGLVISPTTYEIIADTVAIKYCNTSGMYCRSTDSFYNNFIIGMNAYSKNRFAGCNLEGANNNYSNFKVYLNKSGGIKCEDGTANNNYLNFNIQENNGSGLKLNAGSEGITDNNFNNIIFDSNETAIDLWQCGNNVISGIITNKLSTVNTKTWLNAWNCTKDNYIDVIASAGVANTDKQHLIFLKSSP